MLDLTMYNQIKLNVLVDESGYPVVGATSWRTFKTEVRDFLLDYIRELIKHEDSEEQKLILYRLLIKATDNHRGAIDIESVEDVANEFGYTFVRKYVDMDSN